MVLSVAEVYLNICIAKCMTLTGQKQALLPVCQCDVGSLARLDRDCSDRVQPLPNEKPHSDGVRHSSWSCHRSASHQRGSAATWIRGNWRARAESIHCSSPECHDSVFSSAKPTTTSPPSPDLIASRRTKPWLQQESLLPVIYDPLHDGESAAELHKPGLCWAWQLVYSYVDLNVKC